MDFLEAIIKINKRKDISLCDFETELIGEHPSICVYIQPSGEDERFLGKLRWPKDGKPAEVDSEVEKALEKGE